LIQLLVFAFGFLTLLFALAFVLAFAFVLVFAF